MPIPAAAPARLTNPAFAGVHAILFDFGGTLDADGLHWSPRFREAYRRAGAEVDLARWEAAFVEADRRIAREPVDRSGTLRDLLARQIREQIEILGLAPSLLPAILADAHAAAAADLSASARLLWALRPYFHLGVVSNFTGSLERVCREAGLLPMLHAVVDSALVGVLKPDPEIFRLAARRLGDGPDACLVVGDSVDRDVVPARAAGMRAIWLRGPLPRTCPESARPDAVITSLRELPAVLGRDV